MRRDALRRDDGADARARPRARDRAFPLLSPVLVCGVVGTRKAFELQPFDSYSGFLGLMALSVAITLALGIGLFGALVDE